MLVLIINFNRLTLPVKMADWLSVRGCEPVFVDNNSDYLPLLQYYEKTKYNVIRLKNNYGHTVVWQPGMAHIFNPLLKSDRYIVTDPDLDLTGIPDNFLKVLHKGLDKYATYDKCGFSLEINDLPDTEEGYMIKNRYERKYWLKPLDEDYYHADADTTFAMYRSDVRTYNHNAIRTNRPYTAKHVPWYYKDFDSLSEEDRYYFQSANNSSSGKIRLMK
jgi:hypothetical protein